MTSWNPIVEAVRQSVSVALGRRATVVSIDANDLDGLEELQLHEAGGATGSNCAHGASILGRRSRGGEHALGSGDRTRGTKQRQQTLQEQAGRADVVMVHDRVDILLLSCSNHADGTLREHLRRVGCDAASRVVEAAAALQQSPARQRERDWLEERCSEPHNPAALGHKSAGVTFDCGMHDGQLRRAVMLSTTRTPRLPPCSCTLRADKYVQHREARIAKLTRHECRQRT